MDNQVETNNLTDAILKLRLENISTSARKKREKNREFKPLVSNKEVEEYRNNIIKSRLGESRYVMPPEFDLADNFLEQPVVKKVYTEDEINDLEAQKQQLGQLITVDEKRLENATLLSISPLKTSKENIKIYLEDYYDPSRKEEEIMNSLDTDDDIIQYVETTSDDLKMILELNPGMETQVSTWKKNRATQFYKFVPQQIKTEALSNLSEILVDLKTLEIEQTQPLEPDGSLSRVDKQTIERAIQKYIPKLPKKTLFGLLIYNSKIITDDAKKILNESGTSTSQFLEDIDTIKDRIKQYTDEIARINQALKESEENILENQAELDKTKKINKEKLDQYTQMLNFLNVNELNVKQQPDETEEDYLNRLEQIGQATYNEDQLSVYAGLETLDKLKKNLAGLIKNKSTIEDIIRQIPIPSRRHELNKYFTGIKTKFLKLYGFDNTSLSSTEITDILNKFLDEIINEPAMKTEALNLFQDLIPRSPQPPQTGNQIVSPELTREQKLEAETQEVEEQPTLSDIRLEENQPEIVGYTTFTVLEDLRKDKNTKKLEISTINQTLYFKIDNKEIYSSNTGDMGSYNRIYFTDNVKKQAKDQIEVNNRFTNIINQIIPYDQYTQEPIYAEMFNYTNTSTNKAKFYNFLKRNCGLIPTSSIRQEKKKEGMTFETLQGMGISTKYDIPKEPVKYGNILINLYKLYYKNILSIKDLNNGQIQTLKSTPVSDDFVNYIVKIFFKEPTTEADYKRIKSSELELLDQLNYLGGFAKEKNINKEQHVNKLKDELELITGSIMAGNNNLKLLEDLRNVLNKLTSFDAISLQSSKSYLNQFKPYFK